MGCGASTASPKSKDPAPIDVKVENILKDDIEIGEDGTITFDFSDSSEEDARSKAVEIAIAGIDWEEFEAAWKAYTL